LKIRAKLLKISQIDSDRPIVVELGQHVSTYSRRPRDFNKPDPTLAHNKRVLGTRTNGWFANTLGILTTMIMTVAAIALIV
jgi:hypothetical protein